MTKKDIYEVAIKIFGIYSIINAIELIQPIISLYYYTNIGEFISVDMKPEYNMIQIYNVTLCLFHLLLGLFLIFKTKLILKLIGLSGDLETTLTMSIKKETLFELAFLISGIVLIIWSTPQFIIQLKNHIQQVSASTTDFEIDKSFIFVFILKFIFGIICIILAPFFGRFFTGNPIKNEDLIGDKQ